MHPGVGTLAGFALDAEAAAVLLDDSLCQGQAGVRLAFFAVSGEVEGSVYEGLLRARAIVVHFDQELRAVLGEAGAQPQVPATFRQRVEGVA